MRPSRVVPALLVLLAAGCGGSAGEGVPKSAAPEDPVPAPTAPPAPPPPPSAVRPPAAGAPEFRRPDPAKAKTTASGIRYEMVREGTGATPGSEDAFELEFALWLEDGTLLERSRPQGGQIQGRKSDMALAFLKEAPSLLKEGGEALFEVPSSLTWGDRAVGKIPSGATTYWRLGLVRVGKVRPVPEFVLPPETDLRRTPSGLGIKSLREGSGDAPRMGENVVVHYAGWLADAKPGEAKPFDSSYGRGMPTTFRLGEVIEGWNEGLQHMKPGGEAILVIPAAIGYGERGAGAKIPPGATLVFRVELIEVKK